MGEQATEANLNVLLMAVRLDHALAESVLQLIKQNGREGESKRARERRGTDRGTEE